MADTTNQAPKDLIGFLDYYLVTKAPFQIPEGGREAIVKYGPWVLVVLMLLSLPLLLLALGVTAIATPFAMASGSIGGFPWAVAACIQFALRAMALPGLFARKMSGWKLLFYAQLVGLAAALLAGSIVGFVIGGAIGLYILFQVRSLYH
jgi:hypothetical protein